MPFQIRKEKVVETNQTDSLGTVSQALGLREMYKRGWIAYRPQMTLVDAAAVRDESNDDGTIRRPQYPIEEETMFKTSLERSRIDSAAFRLVMSYVFSRFLRPLHARPLSAIRSAIEDRLGSKIFLRLSRWLGPEVSAVAKFYPLQATAETNCDCPIAFYGTITHATPPKSSNHGELLRHRHSLAHEDAHHLRHIHPTLVALREDGGAFQAYINDYDKWLEDGRFPTFGPTSEVAESEADLFGLLLLLMRGYLRIAPHSRDYFRENLKHSGIDTEELANMAAEVTQNISRPSSAKDIKPGPPPLRLGKVDRTVITEASFEELWRLASGIAQEARSRPYAWACKAVEDRFLERRPFYNVSVKFEPSPDAVDEPLCTVHRQDFENAVVRRPSHWIRFTICLPEKWNVREDPWQRIEALRWLGLIDRYEAGSNSVDCTRTQRRFTDYSDEAQEWSRMFAIALDALAGKPGNYDRFSALHADWMLSESSFGLSSLLGHPSWRSRILSVLHATEDATGRLAVTFNERVAKSLHSDVRKQLLIRRIRNGELVDSFSEE